MKKNFNYYIGIDVSKEKLDMSVLNAEGEFLFHDIIVNSPKAIALAIKRLLKKLKANAEDVLFCLEHTGVYGFPICEALSEAKILFSMVSAIEIKRSIGLKRGKNDKKDSKHIAEYAHLKHATLQMYQLPTEALQGMKILISQRDLFVSQHTALKNSYKETNDFTKNKYIEKTNQEIESTLKFFKEKIAYFEKAILEIVKEHESIKELYDLITSVPGVGFITTVNLIVVTNCFTTFNNSRQLASYSGVAPFEYSSGSSIKGRTKVSQFANKKIKSLLSMVVLNAIKIDKEIKAYYIKKQAQGKNKMLVINNIKNKILGRIVATVKRKTPFVPLANHIATKSKPTPA
jgi:transposase